MIIFGALDRALAHAVSNEASLLAARDEWNARAGTVHDDEALYEERAAAFLDWFALDRPDASGRPPIAALIEKEPEGSPERAALVALASSHRSLFRVQERLPTGTDGGLVLDDAWGGGTFRARDRRLIAGVEKGDLLDARIVADVESPPDVLLARIVCVHPREAEAAIRRIVEESRRAGELREELLFRLLRLRVRCERYRHVAPVRVYEAGEPR